MKKIISFSDIELPSNRKFGFFFTTIFLLVGIYLFVEKINYLSYLSFFFTAILLIITLFKEDLLFSLNKLWMKLGILLGMVISPIIMGIVFFGLFTPISLMMTLFRRDELRIKLKERDSYWKVREFPVVTSESFKNQF